MHRSEEKLLWKGKPDYNFFTHNRPRYWIATIIVTVAILAWHALSWYMYLTRSSSMDAFMLYYSAFFLLLPIYLIFIHRLYRRRLWRNENYKITEEGIFITKGFFSPQPYFIPWDEIEGVELQLHARDIATIWIIVFGTVPGHWGPLKRLSKMKLALPDSPSLRYLKNYHNVYQLIIEHFEKVLKEKMK